MILTKEEREKYQFFKQRTLDNFEYTEEEGILYYAHKQVFESAQVMKAKMLIDDYFRSKGQEVFNEISAREGKNPGAPTIDLFDFKHRRAIEVHYRHKEINHTQMLERLRKYRRLFGTTYLLLIQWGEGNGFKPYQGFTFLQDYTMKRYEDAGFKVVFFNLDNPDFSWVDWL